MQRSASPSVPYRRSKKTIKELIPHKKEIALDENKNFTLDSDESSLELFGKKVHLSKNEYAMLDKLAENVGLPVSREELNKVLSSSVGNMCDVYICHLRAKLESVSDKKLIFTVREKGYMLKI